MSRLNRFFDRLEDKARGFLSKYPIAYAFLSAIAIVSFWRGVWEGSSELGIPPVYSLIFGAALMLMTGIFVTNFLGGRVLLSGLTGKKKLEEKTLEEIMAEEAALNDLKERVEHIEDMLEKK